MGACTSAYDSRLPHYRRHALPPKTAIVAAKTVSITIPPAFETCKRALSLPPHLPRQVAS